MSEQLWVIGEQIADCVMNDRANRCVGRIRPKAAIRRFLVRRHVKSDGGRRCAFPPYGWGLRRVVKRVNGN